MQIIAKSPLCIPSMFSVKLNGTVSEVWKYFSRGSQTGKHLFDVSLQQPIGLSLEKLVIYQPLLLVNTAQIRDRLLMNLLFLCSHKGLVYQHIALCQDVNHSIYPSSTSASPIRRNFGNCLTYSSDKLGNYLAKT